MFSRQVVYSSDSWESWVPRRKNYQVLAKLLISLVGAYLILVGGMGSTQELPCCIWTQLQKKEQVDRFKIQTLRQNIHRIVNLDVHMIANSSELFFLRAYDFAVFAFDLPGRITFLGELASNDDRFPIFLGLVCFFTLIFYLNRYFGSAGRSQESLTCINTRNSRLSFSNESFQTTSSACGIGFAAKRNCDGRKNSALPA